MRLLLDILPAVAFVAGCAALVYGVGQIFGPAGWIVAGLLAAGTAVASESR